MLDAASPSLPDAAALSSRSGPVAAPSVPFRRVAVYRDPADALEAWRELEDVASISPYQSRRWLLPWMASTGAATHVSPLLVVAYDDADAPLALLPLGLWRRGVLTVGGFLGGKDSNFNLGLFRPDVPWTSSALRELFRAAARVAPVDLFVLRNQPHAWTGTPNPLAQLPHQASPSFAYKAELTRDPERYFRANLSRESRKKLRQKTARLKAFGPIEYRKARGAAEIGAILDAFVAQRLARSAELGLDAADLPDQRAFLERACGSGGPDDPVELHALFCNDRILATFAGATRGKRFCGMVMSFDPDPGLLRTSPGELLLAALIEAKCRAGLEVFDLGIGEARYKATYCPEPEPLFDSLVAISARGTIFAVAERLRLQAKRSIKQSAWAWKLVQELRRLRRPLSSGVARQRSRARQD